MRMRSYRRAGIYDRAFKDAKTIWDLMTHVERMENSGFEQFTLKELSILSQV